MIRSIMLLAVMSLVCEIHFGQGFCQNHPTPVNCSSTSYLPPPLLLTPLLESGRIKESQEASLVQIKDFPELISYSGYFTVNKTFNSNLFFWFFPAAKGNASAPIILWLEGGPGSSALFGLFLKNGPFSIAQDLSLKSRECSWTSSCSVLYIDNPVGAGYSFTDEGGYSTDEYEVGNNLYTALQQFFMLFPELRSNEFFVTGESYAGKFIPAVCYMIHLRNPTATLKINLKGLAIGCGLIDPESMMNYGDHLYQIGLLDANGRIIYKEKELEILQAIQRKQWRNASLLFNQLIMDDQVDTTLFRNLTGFSVYYNLLYNEDYSAQEIEYMNQYLTSTVAQKMLHVGNSTFQTLNTEIEKYLFEDYTKSVKPWIEVLVENYRVMLYNGQLDMLVPPSLTEAFLDTLCWSGGEAFRLASRNKWYVGEDLAGYSKTAENLTLVMVRNAGHLVPTDQPVWALDMISKFVENKMFQQCMYY